MDLGAHTYKYTHDQQHMLQTHKYKEVIHINANVYTEMRKKKTQAHTLLNFRHVQFVHVVTSS